MSLAPVIFSLKILDCDTPLHISSVEFAFLCFLFIFGMGMPIYECCNER